MAKELGSVNISNVSAEVIVAISSPSVTTVARSTVTKKVKGKDETKTYKGENLEDLKKKHPEAHKLYKKYSAGNAVPNIGVFRIQPGNIRRLPAQPARRGATRAQLQKGAAEAQKKLEAVIKQLEASKKAEEKTDLDALRSQVEEAVEMLKKAQGKK